MEVADLLRRAASMIVNGNVASSSTSTQSSVTSGTPSGSGIPGTSPSNVVAAVHEHRRLFNRQLV